jgi:hypothetical protein
MKNELLIRVGSKLNEDFNTERSKPDTDFRPDSEYHTNIFNALGDSMEDIDYLLWG